MILLACFLMMQYLAVSLAASPWWTPDFIVVGMVLALAKAPKRWMLYSALAAGMMLLWAIRLFVLLAASVLIVGALIAWAASRWDLSNRRVLMILAGLAAALINGVLIWSEDLWSWMMILFLGVRICLTLLCLLCAYPFYQKPAAAASYG